MSKLRINELESLETGRTLKVDEMAQTFDNLEKLKLSSWLKIGDVVTVGSGVLQHVRKIETNDDGTGVKISNSKFANLIPIDGTIRASWLGLEEDGDYTDLLNTQLPVYIVENDVKNIVLDTGSIRVSPILDYAYNRVTFSGKGSLLTDNPGNMLQNKSAERTELRHFSGDLVTGVVYNENVKNAIKDRGEVRVVLLGDSISVGLDRFSDGTIPSGSSLTSGVDNHDRQTSFAEQVYAALVSAMPDVTIKFYNRSIGGLAYDSLASPWDSIGGNFTGREQASAGKAWRDCVYDLEPDLVIHAMGMNANAESNGLDYNLQWYSYLAGKRKLYKFDQAIITTPNPNFIDAQHFGDFREFDKNASKLYVAHVQRAMARKYGLTLIDVAKLSTIKRYGFDPTVCVFSNKKESFGSSVLVKNKVFDVTPKSRPVFSSTTVTFKVTNKSTALDFKIECGSVVAQFDGSSVLLYESVPLAALSAAPEVAFELTENVPYTVTLTVSPSNVTLYRGDNVLLTVSNGFVSDTSPVWIINSNFSGDGATVEVLSADVRSAVHPRYSVDLETNGEMYGKLQWTENENGGGVNHPATFGIIEAYAPPLHEYANKLLGGTLEKKTQIGVVSADTLVYIGKLSRVRTGYASIKGYSNNKLNTVFEAKIHLGPFGTSLDYRVDYYINNPLSGQLYIDDDMCVYIKSIYGIGYFELNGQWANKGVAIYPSGTAPVGNLIPVPVP